MKFIGIAGLAAGLLLAGCVTGPEGHGHGMASHDACMAKMHPKDGGPGHAMTEADKARMMKECPMMKGDHGMPGAPADSHDHGGEDAHSH